MALCILGALSFNVLSGVYPLGFIGIFEAKGFFDLFVYGVTQFLMPMGGILVCIFAGWVVQRKYSLDELFGGNDNFVYKAWLFIVRFVAPILLTFVLIDVATA